MAYFPVVGRLDCESSSALHRGFWQVNGYGIMAVYKSDWDRFGGKCSQLFGDLVVTFMPHNPYCYLKYFSVDGGVCVPQGTIGRFLHRNDQQ